jgi:hypothetical protein
MRSFSPLTPIFRKKIRYGSVQVGTTPGEPPTAFDVHVQLGSGFTDPLFLAMNVNFELVVSGVDPGDLFTENVIVTGDTEAYVASYADFVDPDVVEVTGLREWGDLDLDITHPYLDTVTSDGPFTVEYPYLTPGFVHPVPNTDIYGVAVLGDYRVAICRDIDGSNTMLVILDTTDKNQPAIISETSFTGTFGMSMEYDAGTDRLYIGSLESGTVFDISDETNPVQGDAEGSSGNPRVIGSNLIVTGDVLDDQVRVYDTSNINTWALQDFVTDGTNLNAPLDLVSIGSGYALAVMPDMVTLIDATTPTAITVTSLFTDTSVGANAFSCIYRDGDEVYVAGNVTPFDASSIHVTAVDVSTPSTPTVISSLNADLAGFGTFSPNTIRNFDGDLWVFGSQQLVRVDITSPASMSVIDEHGALVPSTGFPFCYNLVAVQAGYAWACSLGSLMIGIRLGTGPSLPAVGSGLPTGGLVTIDGGDTVHTFTGPGLFRPNGFTDPIDWFAIGGGGAGGTAGSERTGGGGGAGEYDDGSQVISSNVTISIGAGGTTTSGNGNYGSNTNISGGLSVNLMGGAGGGANGSGTANGQDGTNASGGGAQHGGTGGTGVFNGGNGYNSGGADNFGGGGGGGASGNGQAAQSSTSGHAGDGGNGAEWPSGSGDFYGGGGGGGAQRLTGTYVGGSGGSGVGGDGGTDGVDIAATAPEPSTGSGGGGGAFSVAATAGAAGVVIFRYPTP